MTSFDKPSPARLYEAVLPRLSFHAQEWLSILSDGYLAVRFSPETMLKKGTTKDQIHVEVLVGGNPERPSGGEEKRISVATDLGLLSIACEREGGDVSSLVLDEVLDGLDSVGKARVQDLLESIRQTRESVHVISHDESLTEIFEQRILCVREGGRAWVEE